MKSTTITSWKTRAAAAGVALALAGGMSLIGAPAHAAPVTYTVSGLVGTENAEGGTDFSAGVYVGLVDSPDVNTATDAEGNFALGGLANGTYDLDIHATAGDFEPTTVSVTILDADAMIGDVLLPLIVPAAPPELSAADLGTVEITGTPTVGSVLTATTAGWPDGTTLDFQWGYSGGEFGGPIDGATESTYTVTADLIGLKIAVIVTGTKDGAVGSVSAFGPAITAPMETAAPAPVAGSAELAAYLAAHDSTPASQASVGLPTGSLDPNKSYTANVDWAAADSFVDVYLYSSPILVGTFPVVNGVAQVTLSNGVLGQLAAGAHTLVIVGQSSGAVQSVALNIAPSLAATGFDVTAPMTAAGLLLLLGAVLAFTRRRAQA